MGKKRKKNQDVAFASKPIKTAQNSTTQTKQTLNSEKVRKEYLELLYVQKKRENLLLGDFSADGSYNLSDEKILQELKNIPKKFEEKVDNVVYANAILGPYILRFKIEFEIKEDFCSAALKFVEIEQGIEKDIKHITSLDKHLGVYSPTYDKEIYQLWKIYFDEEIFEKNDFLHDYLKKREEEFLFSQELTEVLAQIYLMRMLKFFDGFGEKGEKIKQEYKLLVEKLAKNDPAFMQNHTKLKKILDDLIIKHKALEEISKTAEGAEILNEFASPLRRVLQMATPSIVEAAGKDVKKDEQKDKAKTPAKKPSAKKKGKAKSSGGASFKPFIMDTKKAFGKLSVGGYTLPNFNMPKIKDDASPKSDKQKEAATPPKQTPPKINVNPEPERIPKKNEEADFDDYLDDLMEEVEVDKDNARMMKAELESLSLDDVGFGEAQEEKKNVEDLKEDINVDSSDQKEDFLDDIFEETDRDRKQVNSNDLNFEKDVKNKEKDKELSL